jgi:hypothetical protein
MLFPTQPRHTRRALLKNGSLAVSLSLLSRSFADLPRSPAIEPKLDPKPAVLDKLTALKPNRGVLLGKAEVVGEFNETARKYDLHKIGPNGRDFTINWQSFAKFCPPNWPRFCQKATSRRWNPLLCRSDN